MTVESMATIQILADIALLISILFLIWAVTRERNRRPAGADAETFAEFKKLIEESRRSSDHLFKALQDVREAVSTLDEKERRIRGMAGDERAGNGGRTAGGAVRGGESLPGGRGESLPGGRGKHEDVVRMAGQGLTEKEIAETLHLTEGEICLILDLHRKKNENSTRRAAAS